MGYRLKRTAGGTTTSYADSFARLGAPAGLIGTGLFYQTVRQAASDDYGGFTLDTLQLRGVHSGGANGLVVNPAFLIPRVYANPIGIWGASQFAEMRYRSSVTAMMMGIAVFIRWDYDAQQCYSLQVDRVGASPKIVLDRLNGSARTVLSDAPTTIAADDLLRLEVTAGTPNTLRIYKNAVLIQTLTDANVTAAGAPGIVNYYSNLAGDSRWNDFNSGKLL